MASFPWSLPAKRISTSLFRLMPIIAILISSWSAFALPAMIRPSIVSKASSWMPPIFLTIGLMSSILSMPLKTALRSCPLPSRSNMEMISLDSQLPSILVSFLAWSLMALCLLFLGRMRPPK